MIYIYNSCKISKFFLILFLFLVISSCYNDNNKKEITSRDICSEELPTFIEKFNGDYNTTKLKLLCKCIWNNFPKDGWERKVSKKLYHGEDIGWKIKSFSTIFELNLKKCKSKI
tara:strand:- start:109 stop:450 length:342 start_codon:yes stop_codon:yes gene_type:complete